MKTSNGRECSWHVFLAYASPDREYARLMYDALSQHCRVFWDEQAPLIGRPFPAQLDEAQIQSLMTVALVRKETYHAAYYLKEEVIRAIRLARETGHLLAPVRLDDEEPPYGLACYPWLKCARPDNVAGVALQLRDALAQTQAVAEPAQNVSLASLFVRGDVEAVQKALNRIYPSYLEAHALWLKLRSQVRCQGLARNLERRWIGALIDIGNEHPRGLDLILDCA